MVLGTGVVLGVIVIAVGLLVVFRGDSNEKAAPEFHVSTSVDLQPGTLAIEAVVPPGDFPIEVRDQVLSTLALYVDTAIVDPLRKRTASDQALATIFDLPAIARLTGPDRALLVDEGLPKAVGKVDVSTPPVPMTALVDPNGDVALVTAGVQLSVKAQTKTGRLEIVRVGTFSVSPDESGTWRIIGWTVSTERGGKALAATSASTTPTTVGVAP